MESTLSVYKLIVLYMLDRSGSELTNSQLSEFILDHTTINYFNLQQSISELAEAGLIHMRKAATTSCYSITEEGRLSLSFFEKDVPDNLKRQILEHLKELGHLLEEGRLFPADYYPGKKGGFHVRCQILERKEVLADLTFFVPTEEAARSICMNWPQKATALYSDLVENLM